MKKISQPIRKYIEENINEYHQFNDDAFFYLYKDAKESLQPLNFSEILKPMIVETISHLRKDYSKISEEQFNKILKLDPTYVGGDKETPYTRWIFKLIYNNIKNIENLQS